MRAELPIFSGERRDWPVFKVLWPDLAVPAFPNKKLLASELRRCVKGKARELLQNISITSPAAITAMWQRLTEHYDDAAACVNEVLRKIQNLKVVKSEDYKSLAEFANKVEGCHTQLTTLGQLTCISMRDVDALSALLPVSVREEWHRKYIELSGADQLHPFNVFKDFMVIQRKAVTRIIEQQVTSKARKDIASHHTEEKGKIVNGRRDGATQHRGESGSRIIKSLQRSNIPQGLNDVSFIGEMMLSTIQRIALISSV